MSKRYSILVREFGSDNERTLCEVDSHPQEVAMALSRKLFGKPRLPVYTTVRIQDNQDDDEESPF
jgi:hypothetical protein